MASLASAAGDRGAGRSRKPIRWALTTSGCSTAIRWAPGTITSSAPEDARPDVLGHGVEQVDAVGLDEGHGSPLAGNAGELRADRSRLADRAIDDGRGRRQRGGEVKAGLEQRRRNRFL